MDTQRKADGDGYKEVGKWEMDAQSVERWRGLDRGRALEGRYTN
jgi:hypothetical protein